MKRRRIAVVTTSRADYGHLYWPLKELLARPEIEMKLIAMGAHLSPEFGHTVSEIEGDGFPISARIECLQSSDTDLGMAKTIGVAVLGLAESLAAMEPDILLLIADRYEMLAPASVALALRIPIAHIEGGEISEGAIDDAVRNALTKMGHLHFTATRSARQRVIAMGEEPWRVTWSGAPSLDHLRRSRFSAREVLESKLSLDLSKPPVMVAYHPVTLEKNTTFEADAVFAALSEIAAPIIFCFPNPDAGSRHLIDRAQGFCRQRANADLFVNLNHLDYWSLLKQAALLLGNSSSGIMETPSLALPCINIGKRQQGRERAVNIIDVPPDKSRIIEAVAQAGSQAFRKTLVGMTNPYGDGHAAEKIAEVLATCAVGRHLLIKKAMQI